MAEFLEDIAQGVGLWFPELQGRSIAVSEIMIDKDNVPTLPVAMVALVREHAKGGNKVPSQVPISEEFCVDIILEPKRIKRIDGTETPYWAYYPYNAIRDRLLNNLLSTTWQSRTIEYKYMNVESDDFSVTLSFRFMGHFLWCPDPPLQDGDGLPLLLTGGVKPAPSECCDPGCPEKPCEEKAC